jgi:hypothetical protein
VISFHVPSTQPERKAMLATSGGLRAARGARPAGARERLAHMLHDRFAVPLRRDRAHGQAFLGAARKLAIRARRRLQGAAAAPADPTRQREVAHAFLAASRNVRTSGRVAPTAAAPRRPRTLKKWPRP